MISMHLTKKSAVSFSIYFSFHMVLKRKKEIFFFVHNSVESAVITYNPHYGTVSRKALG